MNTNTHNTIAEIGHHNTTRSKFAHDAAQAARSAALVYFDREIAAGRTPDEIVNTANTLIFIQAQTKKDEES